jgi:hypothetical protein
VTGPVPATGRFGLAELPTAELGREVVASWDAFLQVVQHPATDLSRPSRLAGWSGRDTCIHLGNWDDARVLDSVLASARAGALDDSPSPDAGNEALVRAHRGASDAEVVGALVQARDRLAGWFASEDPERTGRLLSRSIIGPLPVLTLLHAGCYELAVHALDLAPCGAPRPPAPLLQRGLAALLDVTGALTARAGVEISLTGTTPDGGWRFTSGPDGWSTEPHPHQEVDGVGVHATVTDLLDASAGRVSVPQLLLTRRMHVSQLHQWMRLAPLLEELPGLPGGAALRGTVGGIAGVAGGLAGVAGGVGRALGRLRR